MSLAAGFLVLLLCLAGCNPKDMNSVTAQASGQASQEQQLNEASPQEQALGSLNLHYLDVGQGNAVLAESQGRYMLIDGGARKASTFVVSYLEKQGVKELDYLLISHFDEDHLAGAIGALHKFPVKQLITPDSGGIPGALYAHRWRCQKGIFLCSKLSGKAGSQRTRLFADFPF